MWYTDLLFALACSAPCLGVESLQQPGALADVDRACRRLPLLPQPPLTCVPTPFPVQDYPIPGLRNLTAKVVFTRGDEVEYYGTTFLGYAALPVLLYACVPSAHCALPHDVPGSTCVTATWACSRACGPMLSPCPSTSAA